MLEKGDLRAPPDHLEAMDFQEGLDGQVTMVHQDQMGDKEIKERRVQVAHKDHADCLEKLVQLVQPV